MKGMKVNSGRSAIFSIIWGEAFDNKTNTEGRTTRRWGERWIPE